MEDKKITAGQPAFYNSPQELEAAAESFFIFCEGEFEMIGYTDEDGCERQKKEWLRYPTPITITGLALYLGFASRQSFYDYGKREEYSYIINKCRMRVENAYELCLYKERPTGAIFALKNMGWADKQEIDHTTAGDKLQTIPEIVVYNQAPPLASSEDEI